MPASFWENESEQQNYQRAEGGPALPQDVFCSRQITVGEKQKECNLCVLSVKRRQGPTQKVLQCFFVFFQASL